VYKESTNIDSIPSDKPYITVESELTEQWRLKLANNNDFKIGIVWAGRPTFKDHYRSCSLGDFAPLAEIPGITFYSLQKWPASEEILNPPKGMKIICMDKELTDFSDTAAVMKNLDLIISTDTAVVHLAGAIGKPVWTLLHTSSDWRWFLNRENSPWYPTMRLFRQSKFNGWKAVFDQVKEALLQEISDCGLRIADSRSVHIHTQTGGVKNPKSEIRNPKLEVLLHEALKLHKVGDLPSAIMFYNKIIEEHPDNAMVHYNLASALQGLGRTVDALASYRKATELKPDDAEAQYNLGNALREQGKIDKAIVSYKQAVLLKPDSAELHCNLGAALQESGKLDEAIVSYKQAISLNTNYAMAHCNLGSVLYETGKLNDAVTSYERAIELKADFALAHSNLGTALKDLCKLDEAVECYRKAISLKPDYAEAHNNLGTALLEQREFEEAAICHNRAIEIKPEYAEAYNNLGTVLQELSKLNEAVASYKKAIALKPDFADAHNNLGTALQSSGKLGEALTSYKQAIVLNPEFSLAHVNMSFVQLLTQNFKEGWQEHKWRLNIKGRSSTTSRQQMWDGKSLNDKAILVHTEQGFGDTIQFVRYLPMVKAHGGSVIIECQQSLYRLLRNCNGIDEIIEKTSAKTLSVQPYVHTHLLDLPGIFDTTLKSIPLHIPYITPDQILVDQWASRLNDDENFKIGIVWAGNPYHTRDRNRSCSLADFAKLADVSGLSFYSLQKGHVSIESDNPPTGMRIINLDNELNDFADTAAVIANLDLVITVDTAVAHLTGAIGKPVWTLLPFAPDWRWLLKRNDSPWYPSMRLFRQNQPGDWNRVFEKVKHGLLKLMGN
jgi:tetratricopeptide (TPR) repeat protein